MPGLRVGGVKGVEVLIYRCSQQRQVRHVIGVETSRLHVEVAQISATGSGGVQPVVPETGPPANDPLRHEVSPSSHAEVVEIVR